MKNSILSLTLLGLFSIPAFANYVPGRVDVVATCSSLGLDHGYQVIVTQVEGVPNSFKARVSVKTVAGNHLIDEFELSAPVIMRMVSSMWIPRARARISRSMPIPPVGAAAGLRWTRRQGVSVPS